MTKLRAPDGKSVQLLSRALQRAGLAACLENDGSCSGGPIEAHSIQRGVILQALAEAGQVSMISYELDGIAFKRKGRGVATTFTGFCSNHDNQLFQEIDYDNLADIDPASTEQVGLHFLRAVSIELWKKRNGIAGLSAMADKTPAFFAACKQLGIDGAAMQCDRDVTDPAIEGLKKGVDELEQYYNELRQMQNQKDYKDLIVVTRLIPIPAQFAVVSGLSPTQDLAGAVMYDRQKAVVMSYPMPHIGLVILPHSDGTLIHLITLRRSRFQLQPLFDQLRDLAEKDVEVPLSKLVLNHCENVVFRPSAIEGIGESEQKELIRIFQESIIQELPFSEIPAINLFRIGRP